MMRYRNGRRNPHTIYRQEGEAPSDDDLFIGSTTDPVEASSLVEWANDGLESINRLAMLLEEGEGLIGQMETGSFTTEQFRDALARVRVYISERESQHVDSAVFEGVFPVFEGEKFAVFDRALDPEEVKRLYEAGKEGDCPDCGWRPSPQPSVGEYLRGCKHPCHGKPAESPLPSADEGEGEERVWLAEVYWCPRCDVQSESLYHFCKKGPPLIPQLDTETHCDSIVVQVDAASALTTTIEERRAAEAERDEARRLVAEADSRSERRQSEFDALQKRAKEAEAERYVECWIKEGVIRRAVSAERQRDEAERRAEAERQLHKGVELGIEAARLDAERQRDQARAKLNEARDLEQRAPSRHDFEAHGLNDYIALVDAALDSLGEGE